MKITALNIALSVALIGSFAVALPAEAKTKKPPKVECMGVVFGQCGKLDGGHNQSSSSPSKPSGGAPAGGGGNFKP